MIYKHYLSEMYSKKKQILLYYASDTLTMNMLLCYSFINKLTSLILYIPSVI